MTPNQRRAYEYMLDIPNGVTIDMLSVIWITRQARKENLRHMARMGLVKFNPNTWRWEAIKKEK